LESNVHFPTDINLLWDCSRKCLDMVDKLIKGTKVDGWRKLHSWKGAIKTQMRIVSKASQGGGKGKESRIKNEATEYLRMANNLHEKIESSKTQLIKVATTPKKMIAFAHLMHYQQLLTKHIDLVDRRLIKGETIPHAEKLFSIFEMHTEWKTKGKANNKVELGHNILIATDQFGFILYHQVLEHQTDVELSIPLADNLLQRFGETTIDSISFDKGFYKKTNKELLQLYFDWVIMPKKGNKNQAEQAEESTKKFKKLRNHHSAVESDINSLEHHGLNRCPDKGLEGFKRYTSLGVLACNLHRLGNVLIDKALKAKGTNEKSSSCLKAA